MTGQIPKYGQHFAHERLSYHPELSSAVYRLKSDARWYIRSDKTSKRWHVYLNAAQASAAPFPAMRDAMAACVAAADALTA